ncbi:MAG TPA: RNA-binding domain-containing protein [Gemmataceae bacterium]|nr:RNA-binding domain-containing protein [Gemmataceae bacterium]
MLALPHETEWVEWKHNNANPELIGECLSPLANSAALHRREMAYMIWGIEDAAKNVVGTTFKPRAARKGNEELENWLMRSLHPQVNFQIHEWPHQGRPLALFEIPRATHAPVRFGSEEFIRVGSLKNKLKDYPAKEAELWASCSKQPFERGIARADLPGDEVLAHLDFASCFDLLNIPLPTDQKGILSRLAEEKLIVPRPGSRFDVTNLGAILFAKNLNPFDRLSRKALRVIKYRGMGRTETEREWRDAPSQKGVRRGVRRRARLHQLAAAAERTHRPGVPHRGSDVPGESHPRTGRQRPDPSGLHDDGGGADGRDLREARGDHQPRRAAGGHAPVHRRAAPVPQRGPGRPDAAEEDLRGRGHGHRQGD